MPEPQVIVLPNGKLVTLRTGDLDLVDRRASVAFLEQKLSVVLVVEHPSIRERLLGRVGFECLFGVVGVGAERCGISRRGSILLR